MDTTKDDENRVVKLVHDAKVDNDDDDDEFETLNFNVVFTGGNTIDTEACGFLFDALGKGTVGFIKGIDDAPHLTINMNNVDYIESGYDLEDVQWEE